ncbi:hypothetical protein [Bacillus cereus group sp. BY6-1LC]|uniref:hypothetical protein n=1 Tax=Bacillus cereus group sp. BY6-1LC TaxID=3018077 RepID=UPI0022E94B5F|nr:hypothetical protein [Bacillus cereus group sp. BY6-1LC]MDA1802934.1 hypothetical protein [Bacillus cereus group sp. BY6-1LC]
MSETLMPIQEFTMQMGEKIDRDVQDFLTATFGADELQLILRGHLYIEHELEKLLGIYMVEPKHILTDRFMFMNKLNLAIALGGLSSSKKNSYKKLNDLRNRYVHALKFQMTEKDLTGLIDSFDADLNNESSIDDWNEGLPKEYQESTKNKLLGAVLTLWTYLTKHVYVVGVGVYREKIEKLEREFKKPGCTKTQEEHWAECEELLNEMRLKLGMI